ncbi:MAG: hypothetical protein QM831_22125 [Kofleriaceae bacterium]
MTIRFGDDDDSIDTTNNRVDLVRTASGGATVVVLQHDVELCSCTNPTFCMS